MPARRPRNPKPARKASQRPAKTRAGSDWQLQTAKAKFSEVFRRAHAIGPQVVTRGGADAVVILPMEQYELLLARSNQPKSLVEFFRRSPLAGLDLHLERDRDTGRPLAL
jgi:prevent-host-death family protein